MLILSRVSYKLIPHSLQQKLKNFLEQYTVREEHFQKQLEAKDLTVQLAEAKLQHQMELTARESERVKLALGKAKEFSEREMHLQVRIPSAALRSSWVGRQDAHLASLFALFMDDA